MVAINTISLYNSATTLREDFDFRTTQGNSVRWANPGATGAGDKEITITRSENDVVTRVTASIAVPIVNDVGSGGIVVPEVVRTLRAKVEYILPENATPAEQGMLLWAVSDLVNADNTLTASPIVPMVTTKVGLT